ncbi:MAG: N-acetylmuramoyl-L-alanine amidase [Escherichia coli]|nr:N-acetylmuramoyl-L-alanine amidase [Escherichia coli]
MLKAGLAALTLSGMSQAIAKDEPLKTSNGHSKPKAKKSGGKRVVVLDPGHGGIDTGAIGRNGSKEKHVVLAIAKNVRSILRNHGIDARLTRSGDTFIPLYDRVEIAHKHGADLFMSIHADGFTNPKAAGASVFALSNRGSHILKKIKPVHKLHSRNTEQAAFVVLKSPSVPSVLVETSFITNPEEERLLGTAAFRQKIATAIAEGVISYFHWFDNQKAHSKKR